MTVAAEARHRPVILALRQYLQDRAHNPCLSINIHVSLPSPVILDLIQYPQGGATMPDSIIQIL